MNGVVRELKALFGFDLDNASVRRVDAAIDRSRGNLETYQRAQNNVSDGLGRMIRQAVILYGGAYLAGAFWEANTSAQSLQASLELVTGSAEGAATAMEHVREFARLSPDDVLSIGAAYQMLIAQGIDPTMERLRRLGDVAAATQQPMAEVLDAVAGGLIGNTERLDMAFRQFGFNFSSRQGELYVSIAGENRRLGSSYEEVIGFLEELGETEFAGQMARQAQTLSGRLSMLKDAFVDAMIAAGEEGGLNDALAELLDTMTEGIGDSRGIARAIGGTLADAVRLLTQLLEYANEHGEETKLIFMALGSAAIAGPLMRLVDGVVMLNRAMVMTRIAAFATTAAVTGLILGTVLLVDDFIAFMQGRPSVIGVMVGEFENSDGVLGRIANFFADVRDHGGDAASAFGSDIRKIGDRIGEFLSSVIDRAIMLRDWFLEVKDAAVDMLPPQLQQALQHLIDGLERAWELIQEVRQNMPGANLGRTLGRVGNPVRQFGRVASGEWGTGLADAVYGLANENMSAQDAAGLVFGFGGAADPTHSRNVQAATAMAVPGGVQRAAGRSINIESITVQPPDQTNPEATGRAIGAEAARTIDEQMIDEYARSRNVPR